MKRKMRRAAASVIIAMATLMTVAMMASINAYAAPSGTYPMTVNVNGRTVLQGDVFSTGEATYVPMFRFADWLGVFSYSYNSTTGTAYVKGDGLEISARSGELYICANGRYFYTVAPNMIYNGEMYVAIRPLVKALNSRIEWSDRTNSFVVRSGDTSLLKSGDQVYRDDEVLWLSRIISAEAQGEPMKGKIAVGNVVLNRTRSSAFPNTIYSVIFDKKYGIQFAPVANGTIYKTPTAESVIAAKMCLEGYSLSTEVLYFMNPKYASSSWIAQSRPFAFGIGNHVFFE